MTAWYEFTIGTSAFTVEVFYAPSQQAALDAARHRWPTATLHVYKTSKATTASRKGAEGSSHDG